MQRLLLVSFWSALVFAFVMAVLPQPPSVPLAPSDKVQHVLAFATLAGLGSAAYVTTPLWKIGAWLAGFGGLIEVVQAIPALHRDASALDWIADIAAVAFVMVT